MFGIPYLYRKLDVLRRPPLTILRLYQKTSCQMQLLNLMVQNRPRVKLEADQLDKWKDLPFNIKRQETMHSRYISIRDALYTQMKYLNQR